MRIRSLSNKTLTDHQPKYYIEENEKPPGKKMRMCKYYVNFISTTSQIFKVEKKARIWRSYFCTSTRF